MPDKYGFDHLPNRGVVAFKCVEVGCNVGGLSWEWPESRRKIHFLAHNFSSIAGESPKFGGPIKISICRICGSSFEQEKKRGRPRVQCYVCKPIQEVK